MILGIKQFIESKSGAFDTSTPAKTISAATQITECSSEFCVANKPEVRRFITEKSRIMSQHQLDAEKATRYKVEGPRNSRDLVSNTNIDGCLQSWARSHPEFYPCRFAMMDFDTNGDQFGDFDFRAMLEGRLAANLGRAVGAVRRKFSCFRCVVNTDVSRGPGKHWVCVFVDCRPPPGEPWTIEYFNSSGNPPSRVMIAWMTRVRFQLLDFRSKLPGGLTTFNPVIAVPVTDITHQNGNTECGVYALFYIRRRLESLSHSAFNTHPVSDKEMSCFRRHLFRDCAASR